MQKDNVEDTNFTYFLSEKSSVLIVSLIGPLTRATSAIFEKCQDEVRSREAKWVILNFHDVSKIELPLVPALARFQKSIRDKSAELRICFLRPDLRVFLEERGLLRPNEVAPNLADALKLILPSAERKAA